MPRKITAISLAVLTAWAVSATAAPTASANRAFDFFSDQFDTTLSGTQHGETNEVFTTDTGTISCNKATYSGTFTGTSVTELEIEPSFSECTAFGVPATTHTNGCRWKFTAGTGTIMAASHSTRHLVCTGPKHYMEFTAPGCRVTMTAQNNIGSSTFTNVANGDLTVDVSETGITYEEHTQGIFPTCKNHTSDTTNGTFTGAFLINGGSANISVALT